MNLRKTFGKLRKIILETAKKDLKEAGSKTGPKEFVEKGVKYSLVFAALCSLSFLLFAEEISYAVIVFAASFLAGMSAWFYIPKLEKKKKAESIEKDLPAFLMALSVQLNVNVPVFQALKNVSEKEQNSLGKEFLFTLRQVEGAGTSLQKAFFDFGQRFDSFLLKRSLAQIISLYEQGPKNAGQVIRSLAKEQLSLQRTQSKEFSGKLVVYSLMFIAVSTVFPALFQTMVLVGSTFMEMDFSPMQVLFIVVIVFPAIDIAALYYVRSKTPGFLK